MDVPVNPPITGINPHIHVHERVSTKNKIKYRSDL